MSAQLVSRQPPPAPLSIVIDIRNVSPQAQEIFVPDWGAYEGLIYLQKGTNRAEWFVATNFFYYATHHHHRHPIIMAAGESLHFEFSLCDFVEIWRPRLLEEGNKWHLLQTTLCSKFQEGTEIWCEYDIFQKGTNGLSEGQRTHRLTTPRIYYSTSP